MMSWKLEKGSDVVRFEWRLVEIHQFMCYKCMSRSVCSLYTLVCANTTETSL